MHTPSQLIDLPVKDDLKLSEIVDSVKDNYAISFGNRVQLESLQEWIRLQIDLYK